MLSFHSTDFEMYLHHSLINIFGTRTSVEYSLCRCPAVMPRMTSLECERHTQTYLMYVFDAARLYMNSTMATLKIGIISNTKGNTIIDSLLCHGQEYFCSPWFSLFIYCKRGPSVEFINVIKSLFQNLFQKQYLKNRAKMNTC